MEIPLPQAEDVSFLGMAIDDGKTLAIGYTDGTTEIVLLDKEDPRPQLLSKGRNGKCGNLENGES